MGIWKNMAGGVTKLHMKNNCFFILNWKMCYHLFVRKFMLRLIFALKIIKEFSWELQSRLSEDFKRLYNKIWESVLIIALMTHHIQPLPSFLIAANAHFM